MHNHNFYAVCNDGNYSLNKGPCRNLWESPTVLCTVLDILDERASGRLSFSYLLALFCKVLVVIVFSFHQIGILFKVNTSAVLMHSNILAPGSMVRLSDCRKVWKTIIWVGLRAATKLRLVLESAKFLTSFFAGRLGMRWKAIILSFLLHGSRASAKVLANFIAQNREQPLPISRSSI